MKKLSIVVPCYNEQETIYPFLEETQKIESKMKDQLILIISLSMMVQKTKP